MPGRPGERYADSRPRRLAIRFCHSGAPYGRPRWTLRRSASNSLSLSARLTRSSQSSGTSNGHAAKTALSSAVPRQRLQRLDQRHSSARTTKLARKCRRRSGGWPLWRPELDRGWAIWSLDGQWVSGATGQEGRADSRDPRQHRQAIGRGPRPRDRFGGRPSGRRSNGIGGSIGQPRGIGFAGRWNDGSDTARVNGNRGAGWGGSATRQALAPSIFGGALARNRWRAWPSAFRSRGRECLGNGPTEKRVG